MKNYKSVNSKEMKKKAEKMGLELSDHFHNDSPFIVLEFSVGRCWTSTTYDLDDDFEEITQADFLALPEPIKIGDWCRFIGDNDSGNIVTLFKVISEGETLYHSMIECDGSSASYHKKGCTKLTPEQIKVLGLEE